MSATTVLARKWRPKTFAQLAGQDHVVRALSNALTQDRLHHAYLFTGTRGVGKTTIARIFAKSLNCTTGVTATPCGVCSACIEIDTGRFIDLIELDAASNTGIDNMREVLDNAQYVPSSGRYKVYIIDEVHMLSKQAFNSMLKTLEEPPGHVKFILATTDPQKIPVTVLSRCLQFNLKQLPPALISKHLSYVLEQEQILFEAGAIALIARAAQGSMRDALSLLDQAIAFSPGKIEEAVVRTMLGTIDQGYLFDLLTALHLQDGAKLLDIANNMAAVSASFDAALQEMATLLHRIALAQNVPLAITDEEPERLRLLELAQVFSVEEVQLYYQIAIHGRDDISLAPDDYAGFTMTLLRMLAFAPTKNSAEVMPISSAPPRVDSVPKKNKNKNEGRATSEIVAAEVASNQPTGNASESHLDWGVLLSKLNVQGMAQQLAKHCVLQEFSERQITLSLSQDYKHLQTNKMSVEKLQSALIEYFARPLTLNIVLGSADKVTPARIEHQNQQIKQQDASDSIAHDSFVREAQAELGATLISESVKPAQQT